MLMRTTYPEPPPAMEPPLDVGPVDPDATMADRVLKQLVILVDAGRLDQVCAPHLAPPSMPEECIGVRELHMLAEQLYAFGRPGGSKPFPDSVLDAIKNALKDMKDVKGKEYWDRKKQQRAAVRGSTETDRWAMVGDVRAIFAAYEEGKIREADGTKTFDVDGRCCHDKDSKKGDVEYDVDGLTAQMADFALMGVPAEVMEEGWAIVTKMKKLKMGAWKKKKAAERRKTLVTHENRQQQLEHDELWRASLDRPGMVDGHRKRWEQQYDEGQRLRKQLIAEEEHAREFAAIEAEEVFRASVISATAPRASLGMTAGTGSLEQYNALRGMIHEEEQAEAAGDSTAQQDTSAEGNQTDGS